MRYLVRAEFGQWDVLGLNAWGDRISFKAPSGEEVYRCVGKALSLGNVFSFQDARGTELLRISPRVNLVVDSYRIRLGERIVANVRDSMSPLCRDPIITLTGSAEPVQVSGDLDEGTYDLEHHEQTIAKVSGGPVMNPVSFSVDIRGGREILLLAVLSTVELIRYDSVVRSA